VNVCVESSSYVTLSAEPTAVVAMAGGWASVGAAMAVKLADLNVSAPPLSLPPHAASRPAEEAPAPRGSSGMLVSSRSVLRRVIRGVWGMGFPEGCGMSGKARRRRVPGRADEKKSSRGCFLQPDPRKPM